MAHTSTNEVLSLDQLPRRTTIPNMVAASRAPANSEILSTQSSTRPGPRNHAVLFALSGPEQGAVFPLHGTVILVGRSAQANISLTDEAVSTRHARIARRDGGVFVQDDGSRNGTYVNDERLETTRQLIDGDHVAIGNTIFKFSLLDQLEERALTQLFELSIRDPLTRAFNRRHFTAHLQTELAFAERSGTPLALLLVDVDHFKRVNDTFGHGVGDVVLQLVAASIQRMLRPYDVLCRYGGEEFVVVARDSSLRNAEILAERVRRHVEALRFDADGATGSVTVSVGVTSLIPGGRATAGALFQAVDDALYEAKEAGRNCVRVGRASSTLDAPQRAVPDTQPPAAGSRAPQSPDPAVSIGRLPPLPRVE